MRKSFRVAATDAVKLDIYASFGESIRKHYVGASSDLYSQLEVLYGFRGHKKQS